MKATALLLLCFTATFLIRANATERPLPPVDTVMEKVLEQAKKESETERKFKETYSYARSKKTEFKNSKRRKPPYPPKSAGT